MLCINNSKKAAAHLLRINPTDLDILDSWFEDPMTVIIDENATPESIAKAAKQEKERSYV